TWCPPETNTAKDTKLCNDRPKPRKRPRIHAAFGNFRNTCGVAGELLRWLSRLRSRRLGGCRLRCRRLRCRASRGWSRHAGPRVIEIDHRLGDVSAFAIPQDRALRPWVRSIHNHGEA